MSLLELSPKEQQKLHEGKTTVSKIKKEKAESNGHAEPAKPPMRKRKEVEEAMEEFKEGSKERNAIEWFLGLRDKIS